MKIIVPMSGLGSRFQKAGYLDPKPLIKVHGKPMIEWVTNLFPGEDDFIYICRNEHLETTPMRDILSKMKPNAQIIGINGSKKGPVHAIAQVFDALPDEEAVTVSYCDYYMHWDWQNFKKLMSTNNCDGAIPCYTGFHPNLLPAKNLYASCKVEADNYLIEIREKFSFTSDKQKSLHSPGMYYFKSGRLLKKYFQKMLDEDLNLNGEYYVSLVYNLMVRDGLNVFVPSNVSYFCQWGTPEDLQEYLFWINAVKGFAI